MNVLSLFDGCAGAYQALKMMGVKPDKYFASEIEREPDGKIAGKYAMKVAKKNHPDIIHIGDVCEVRAANLPKIDLLIGGSPCTDLSSAGGREGLAGSKSKLFFEYLRLLKSVKPKYFLLENVKSMTKENRDIISKLLGITPIMINGALVTAQNRARYFWHNMPNLIMQPADKGILLKDIVEPVVDEKYYLSDKLLKSLVLHKSKHLKKKNGFGFKVHDDLFEKTRTLSARYYKDGSEILLNQIAHLGQNKRQDRIYDTAHKSVTLAGAAGGMGAKTGMYAVKEKSLCVPATYHKENIKSLVQRGKTGLVILQRPHGFNAGGVKKRKAPALTASAWEHNNLLAKISTGEMRIRKLTPTECERLMGFTDGYTAYGDDGVKISDTQRYAMMGKSFIPEVIAHILTKGGF